MFSKVSVLMVVAGICLSIFVTGCAPEAELSRPAVDQANLSLNFIPGSAVTYKALSEVLIDYRFEQPSVKKLEEKRSGSKIELEFVQQVESVDPAGNAVAKITIRGIKHLITSKTGVLFDFDSSREADMAKPLAKLIGQSYTIQLSPDGNVKVVDVKEAAGVVKSGRDKKIAAALLSDKSLSRIHRIHALPDTAGIAPKKGYSWTMSQKSHPRLQWAPKTFQKTYTVASVENKGTHQIASVAMNANEDTGSDDDQSPALPGPLGQLFDPQESFNGQMVIELDTGIVQKYSEKFVGTYTAVDPMAKKDPDILTMGFTDAVSIELVD
jgi:hypothetical protein